MYDVDRSVKSFRRSVRVVAKRGYDMSNLKRQSICLQAVTLCLRIIKTTFFKVTTKAFASVMLTGRVTGS